MPSAWSSRARFSFVAMPTPLFARAADHSVRYAATLEAVASMALVVGSCPAASESVSFFSFARARLSSAVPRLYKGLVVEPSGSSF